MKRTNGHIGIVLLLAAGLLAGCAGSGDEPTTVSENTPKEIRLTPNVWRVMDAATARQQAGTRAATFDNPTALQAEASFTCSAYEAGTTTGYFTGATVEWNNRISSHWAFTTAKYWPAPISNAVPSTYPFDLDFFAYMPATPPAYITAVTYAVSGTPAAPAPYFTCNMTQTIDKEFIWALTTAQNKDSNSGTVDLDFKHPFARLKFQLSASHPDITIYTITLKNLKTGGTCTFNGSTTSWSTASAATADFVADINQACSTSESVQDLGTNYIVVPQTLDLEITVKAGWIDWGETIPHYVSTTLTDVTWAAGTSYTYIFTITESDLKVDTTKFTEQW